MNPQATTPMVKKTPLLRTAIIVVAILAVSIFLYSKFFVHAPQTPLRQVERQTTMNIVRLDSQKLDVLGFDLIIRFDEKTATIGTITSMRPDLQVLQKLAAPGVMTVTVIKPISAEGPIVLNNTPVLKVPVTHDPGQGAVSLVPKYERNTAKFVDAETRVVYLTPELMSIAAE